MVRETLPHPSFPSLFLRVVCAELGQRARRVARGLGLRRPHAVDAAALAPPDSELARRAATLVRELSPRYLVNHCERTFAFGAALGVTLGKRVDRELLYVAAILHDLGLTEAHLGPRPFELRGADAAHAFCVAQDVGERRSALVHEAIALHTSLEAARGEPEVALVHFGAGLDVIGYHGEDVAPETLEAVLAAWPRLGFKTRICEALGREAATTPESPMGVQWRFGFAKRVAQAPFAE